MVPITVVIRLLLLLFIVGRQAAVVVFCTGMWIMATVSSQSSLGIPKMTYSATPHPLGQIAACMGVTINVSARDLARS